MNSDILILCATKLEISPYLQTLIPCDTEQIGHELPIYSARFQRQRIRILITGPGVFNTARALTVCLEKYRPDLIIQAGIAGVFKETGLSIGDSVIATSERYIHVGIQSDNAMPKPLPFDLIEGEMTTKEGFYQFNPRIVDEYYTNILRQKIPLEKGAVITVSTITSSFEQAGMIYNACSSKMAAMEGAAAIHVAFLYRIPILEIRSASNFVGERDKTKWNVEKAAYNLSEILACI